MIIVTKTDKTVFVIIMSGDAMADGADNIRRKDQNDFISKSLHKSFDTLISVLTLASLCTGLYAYFGDQPDREFSANVAAWTLLANTHPGNFGQRSALELLARHGASMNSLNLSGVDLSSGDYKGIVIPNASIIGSNFSNADLRNAYLQNAVLDATDFSFANLSGARGNISSIKNSNVTGVIFPDDTKQNPSNLGSLASREACVNPIGPPPVYASGSSVGEFRACRSYPDGQALNASDWGDKSDNVRIASFNSSMANTTQPPGPGQ